MGSNSLQQAVTGKNIIITGGSSGIGESTAYLLAKAGAHVILVARSMSKLAAVRDNIDKFSGKVSIYSCDLTDMDAIVVTSQQILQDHQHIDVLVNNAGRSIRRSIDDSFERFHDFERTMDINYFGAIKLILELMPHMLERKQGHIINISSIGVLANSPRFSSYVASKAALDAFSRCIAAEVKGRQIDLTTIYMPLVRTPMIAPTKMYNYLPALNPSDAANLVAQAIIEKPVITSDALGKFAFTASTLFPKISLAIQSSGYRFLPNFTKKQPKNKNPKSKIFRKVLSKIPPFKSN